MRWLGGSSRRQLWPLIGSYVCNAFADLSVSQQLVLALYLVLAPGCAMCQCTRGTQQYALTDTLPGYRKYIRRWYSRYWQISTETSCPNGFCVSIWKVSFVCRGKLSWCFLPHNPHQYISFNFLIPTELEQNEHDVMVMVMPGCVAPDRGGCGAAPAPATSCPHLHKKVGWPIFHQLVQRPHTLSIMNVVQPIYLHYFCHYLVMATRSLSHPKQPRNICRFQALGAIYFIHVSFLGFARTYKI